MGGTRKGLVDTEIVYLELFYCMYVFFEEGRDIQGIQVVDGQNELLDLT